MLTIIEGGQIYTPEPIGRGSIVLGGGRIERMGEVDVRSLTAGGLECEVIDASDCLVIPGLIDPHQHLLGGSGERGFSSQTPELTAGEIVRSGITTVVGLLGVDNSTKTMPALLAKAKALREEGLTALIWSGGYSIPPATLTGSVREDMMLVEEVIGAGEIAIADLRATEPTSRELARLATECYTGRLFTGKAGLVHVHVGDREARLSLLRETIEAHDVEPCWFYPTHIERTESLLDEACELSRRGMPFDIDVVEEDLTRWLPRFLSNGGKRELLTVSTDASINSPRTLFEQVTRCVRDLGLPIEQILPCVTRNSARILNLRSKGELREGLDADLVVVRKSSMEIMHVVAGGRVVVRSGTLVRPERFLEQSNRTINLRGAKGESHHGQ